MIQTLVPLAFTLSLAGLLVAVGLDAALDDLLYLFRRPVALAKAILAVNVVTPLAAVMLVSLFPLEPVVKGGILLMAVSPMPPLVPGKELKFGAGKSYAYGLYTALIVLAVAIVPLTVAILARLYGVEAAVSPVTVARNVGLTAILPLALGLLIRRLAPALAKRAIHPVKIASFLLLAVAGVFLVVGAWSAMLSLIGNGTILAMAGVVAVALAAGHFLGGPEPAERASLAIAAATRHPGIALMIATANHADKAVVAAILEFMLVGAIVAVPYQIWTKRRSGSDRHNIGHSPAPG